MGFYKLGCEKQGMGGLNLRAGSWGRKVRAVMLRVLVQILLKGLERWQ